MANKNGKKTVETIVHEKTQCKNTPTAEFHSIAGKEEQAPVRIAYERGTGGAFSRRAGRSAPER